ncbi:O43 family O-antigen polymerase, partial [Escherichia coli]|nr:O43 family O-antigen polymerase [Escherichia coli]
MTIAKKKQLNLINFIRRFSILFFLIIFLSLSPNYIFIFYPELKFVIAILGAILALLGICDVRKIFKTYSSLFLFLFYGVLFFTSIISYIIYGNLNGVYFSLSILFKFLIVIIFV